MKDEKRNSEIERKNQDKTSEISDSFSAVGFKRSTNTHSVCCIEGLGAH